MKMGKLNLHIDIATKLILIIFLFCVITVGGVFVFTSQIFTVFFSQLYTDKALSIAMSLDAGISLDDLTKRDVLYNKINKYLLLEPEMYKLNINLLGSNKNLYVFASTDTTLLGSDANNQNMISFDNDRVISHNIQVDGSRGLWVITPVTVSGQKVGTFEIFLSMQSSYSVYTTQLMSYLWLAIGGVFIITAVFFQLIRRTFVLPIRDLVSQAEKIGEGDWLYRFSTQSNDEIGALGKALNQTTANLRKSYQLLQAKNNELEKANKLMVGRELTMIELKKKIRDEHDNKNV